MIIKLAIKHQKRHQIRSHFIHIRYFLIILLFNDTFCSQIPH
ncbi:hypothetical protein CDIV41_140302 [Carnobacterium divergens]|nr:hypothetical protein CDIV41_140302 [Carnobacterium divergens]